MHECIKINSYCPHLHFSTVTAPNWRAGKRRPMKEKEMAGGQSIVRQ